MRTARAFEPSDGPTTPRRSSRSISRPARAKPTLSLRCSMDVDPSWERTTSSMAWRSSSSSSSSPAWEAPGPPLSSPSTPAQQYTADDSDVAVTVTTNAALGLTVTAWTFVLPDADVLVNHYRVERAPGSPVRTASVVFYANLAPTMNRLPDFPVADWGLDFENDYAVVYDHRAHALLAFLPRSAATYPHDFSLVNPLLQHPPAGRALAHAVDRLVAQLTEPGIYVALGAAPRDTGFQAGFDDAPLCSHQSAIAD